MARDWSMRIQFVLTVPEGSCHTRSWSTEIETPTLGPLEWGFQPSTGPAHEGLSAGCHCLQTMKRVHISHSSKHKYNCKWKVEQTSQKTCKIVWGSVAEKIFLFQHLFHFPIHWSTHLIVLFSTNITSTKGCPSTFLVLSQDEHIQLCTRYWVQIPQSCFFRCFSLTCLERASFIRPHTSCR